MALEFSSNQALLDTKLGALMLAHSMPDLDIERFLKDW